MHALSHSLTHRGPGAGTRARSRWQPYASSASITPTRSPAPYLITPTTTVSTSPPHSNRPAPTRAPSDISRQALKCRYVTALIDQTVKSLCEIWQPYQLPHFTSINTTDLTQSTLPLIGSVIRPTNTVLSLRNTQLPSPVSPSTQSTPSLPPFIPTSTTQPSTSSCLPPSDPVPLKDFVQEVLRRSRTSGSVLQTALCYLEAVRRKIPGIAAQGLNEQTQEESPIDFGMHAPVPSPERPLASPLLCPRRTFLASLILASKFLQDRCYSNRAWAKLSGLSPREIGRCEKALGDALEWRLWVGKSASKPLVRSRTDLDLVAPRVTPTGRVLARARTVPMLGTDPQPLGSAEWITADFYGKPPLDPYQEWLLVNQSRLDMEEEDDASVTAGSGVDYGSNFGLRLGSQTMSTPSLVLSPTSTVCASESGSYDSDEGERTIQVSDISDPFIKKVAGGGYGWYGDEHIRVVEPNTMDCSQLATPWC